MAIDDSRLPLVLPASVARVQDDGRPTKPLIDNEFATRQWYLQNATDLDQKITTVQSETETSFAEVHTEIDAATSATSALASTVTTHTAQIGANSAAISDETAARVSADGVFASQFSSLSTTVSGNTASIVTLTSSVNGVSVQNVLKASLNGTTGGWEFLGVQKADGTGAVFSMTFNSNVTINGDVLINGSLTTVKLGANAVSQTSGTVGIVRNGSLSIPTSFKGGYPVLIQVSISPANGNDVRNGGAAADSSFIQRTYAVRLDGTVVGQLYSADVCVGNIYGGHNSSGVDFYNWLYLPGATSSAVYLSSVTAGVHTVIVDSAHAYDAVISINVIEMAR
jgi:hypothetical protein